MNNLTLSGDYVHPRFISTQSLNVAKSELSLDFVSTYKGYIFGPSIAVDKDLNLNKYDATVGYSTALTAGAVSL